MQGDPAAVVYQHDGQTRPYVYVSGNDGHLYVCYYDYNPAIDNWVWADLGRPAGARIDSSPEAIVSTQRAHNDFMHIFVRGNDGDLHERRWDNARWVDWIDHGHLQAGLGYRPSLTPSALIDRRQLGTGEERLFDASDLLYVFAMSSRPGTLLFSEKLGISESWQLFRPPVQNNQMVELMQPSAVNVQGRPMAFAIGDDGRLHYLLSSTADNRVWRTLSVPPPAQLTNVQWSFSPFSVVETIIHDGQLHVFCQNLSSDHIWVYKPQSALAPDGNAWEDVGGFDPLDHLGQHQIAAVIHSHQGSSRPYLFGTNHQPRELFVYWHEGGNWRSASLGKPAEDVQLKSGVSAVVHTHNNSARPYAFTLGEVGMEDRLFVCYYDYNPAIDNWVWADLKRPNATGA